MNKRIYIIGVSATGKTTLAKILAKKLKCKYYDLDDFYFKRKYDLARTRKEMERLVKNTIKRDRWVIEGSYSMSPWVRLIAKRADQVIWINKPLHILTWRIIKRALTKAKPRPEHSRMREIIDLMKFLTRYHFGESKKAHKRIIATHLKGYVLKTNKQIDNFVKTFN